MRRTALLVAALAAGLVTVPQPATAQPPPAPAAAPDGQEWRVTLITGDEVQVTRNAAGRYSAMPISRSGKDTFEISSTPDHLYVVPSSVHAGLGTVLDLSLFDVRTQVDQQLDDAHTDGVPVLIAQHGAEDPGQLEATTAGAVDAQRVLPNAGVVAGTVDKDRGLPSTMDGVEKIWLDHKVHANWDRNLDQVHAPQAWAAGFDGTGVKLAVLDTGADPTHPDLAGRIGAGADFTGKGSYVDGHGHGTHCAAIAAGSGAGNSGDRKGVAPGVSLLVGKVMGDNGSGRESDVIAGMEWAVAQGADVVSMSLGGIPTDGTDPLSQTVNRLTEQGTLFVIAAGNNGPPAQTVGAPGAADGALTVAAVDGNDQVAEFSSRGPRVGDGALKPDVSAPGVRITAARAAGTTMGVPVDDRYTTASGTSMATPHVAGAAAAVLQRHPDWTPAQVKAALAGTADPTPDTSPNLQGAGRINLEQVLAATVVPEDEDIDFATLRYPQTDVASRTARWRNEGSTDVTLDLTLEVRGPDGRVLPTDQAWLSAPTVTVPAGGRAEVSVNADPRLTVPGQHTGVLVATVHGTGTRLRTPVGFTDEQELYNLTVRGIDRAGTPAALSLLSVVNVDDVFQFYALLNPFPADGTMVYRVPKGHYHLTSNIYDRADDRVGIEVDAVSPVTVPELDVSADTTVTLDARANVRSGFTLDGLTTSTGTVGLEHTRTDAFGRWLSMYSNGLADTPVYLSPQVRPVTVGRYDTSVARRLVDRQVRIRTMGHHERSLRVFAISDLELAPSGRFDVVDLGAGAAKDFAGRDVAGKLVVVRRGIDVVELTERAKAAGAALLAVTNTGPDLFDVHMVRLGLPVVTLGSQDGAALRSAGRVTVESAPYSAFTYELLEQADNGLPQPVAKTYSRTELRLLAVIHARYPREAPDQIGMARTFGDNLSTLAFLGTAPVGRVERTEYVQPALPVTGLAFWDYPRPAHSFTLLSLPTTLRQGEHVQSTWFGPPIRGQVGRFNHLPVSRTVDTLTVEAGVSDGDGHFGMTGGFGGGDTVKNAIRLYRNDVLTGESTAVRARLPLSAESAHYRLVKDLDASLVTPLRTVSSDEWEFDSVRPPDTAAQVLPLPMVDLDLRTDDVSRLTDRYVTVNVVPQPALSRVDARQLRMWYSTDDGVTWRSPQRTVRRSANTTDVKLPRLAAGKVLSFKVETTTTAGVRLVSTTIRAVMVDGGHHDRSEED